MKCRRPDARQSGWGGEVSFLLTGVPLQGCKQETGHSNHTCSEGAPTWPARPPLKSGHVLSPSSSVPRTWRAAPGCRGSAPRAAQTRTPAFPATRNAGHRPGGPGSRCLLSAQQVSTGGRSRGAVSKGPGARDAAESTNDFTGSRLLLLKSGERWAEGTPSAHVTAERAAGRSPRNLDAPGSGPTSPQQG